MSQYCIRHQRLRLGTDQCPDCEKGDSMISDDDIAMINRLRNTPLVAACRVNDAVAEKYRYAGGMEAIMGALGLLDMQALLHVASQRALRAHPDAPESVRLMLIAVCIDAIAVGWTARHFEINGVPDMVQMDPVTMDQVEVFDAKMRDKK